MCAQDLGYGQVDLASFIVFSVRSPTFGFDKTQLRHFLRGYFLANPSIELLVNVESLEFPADGLARAELNVTRVSLNDPQRLHLAVELRRTGDEWRVQRADRIQR